MKAPEILKKYELYGHIESGHTLRLFAIGNANWDYYADEKGTLYSIAKPGSKADGTYFGDCAHIRYLQRTTGFNATFTEYGKRLMEIA